MRDFPIFTTEYGVSSLVLKEIPYRNEAYIHIRAFQPGGHRAHLEECVAFCRMAGAEKIFAAGEGLEAYPVHASVLQMRGPVCPDPEKTANLFPVTEKTASQWRELHNRAMASVDIAGTLEARDEGKLLETPGAYFIHEDGVLLGIGWLRENTLLALAAVVSGAGERVVQTLLSTLEEETVTLEVASTNHRAIRFYERLGFVTVGQRICWHDVSNLHRCRIDECGNL